MPTNHSDSINLIAGRRLDRGRLAKAEPNRPAGARPRHAVDSAAQRRRKLHDLRPHEQGHRILCCPVYGAPPRRPGVGLRQERCPEPRGRRQRSELDRGGWAQRTDRFGCWGFAFRERRRKRHSK